MCSKVMLTLLTLLIMVHVEKLYLNPFKKNIPLNLNIMLCTRTYILFSWILKTTYIEVLFAVGVLWFLLSLGFLDNAFWDHGAQTFSMRHLTFVQTNMCIKRRQREMRVAHTPTVCHNAPFTVVLRKLWEYVWAFIDWASDALTICVPFYAFNDKDKSSL